MDSDSDGQGDKCDDDKDEDGIPNDVDNCPLVKNPAQIDTNSDGTGDDCTNDKDGDGTPDSTDSCPENALIQRPDLR